MSRVISHARKNASLIIVAAIAAACAIIPAISASPRNDPPAAALSPLRPAPRVTLAADSSPAYRQVTVAPGDTLSLIAWKAWRDAPAWPAIWRDNSGEVRDPNVITVGERLRVPAAPPSSIPYASSAAPVRTDAVQSAPAPSHVSVSGDSSFQACVISRESGGNPNIWNASGHYGLYQFSESTWIDYGGPASEFGHATVAEQDQVFDNAMATPDGADNWSPYDGCLCPFLRT